jgi:hypothetical protein
VSQLITTHFVQQYTTNVQLLLQQKGSRLRGSVREGMHVGEQAVPVDQIGKVEATKRGSRYPDLTPSDTPTDRRWVFPSDYDWNDLIDNVDKLRMLTDPQSSYVLNGTYAMGRAMDNEIIPRSSARRRPARRAAPRPPSRRASRSACRSARRRPSASRSRSCARRSACCSRPRWTWTTIRSSSRSRPSNTTTCSAKPRRSAWTTTRKPVLVDGKITSFMGFNFIHTELLVLNGSGYRRVPAYAQSGMYLGIWNDIRTDVSQRKDKAGLPWQVYVYGTFGATRLEEKKVVEIPCSEA